MFPHTSFCVWWVLLFRNRSHTFCRSKLYTFRCSISLTFCLFLSGWIHSHCRKNRHPQTCVVIERIILDKLFFDMTMSLLMITIFVSTISTKMLIMLLEAIGNSTLGLRLLLEIGKETFFNNLFSYLTFNRAMVRVFLLTEATFMFMIWVF